MFEFGRYLSREELERGETKHLSFALDPERVKAVPVRVRIEVSIRPGSEFQRGKLLLSVDGFFGEVYEVLGNSERKITFAFSHYDLSRLEFTLRLSLVSREPGDASEFEVQGPWVAVDEPTPVALDPSLIQALSASILGPGGLTIEQQLDGLVTKVRDAIDAKRPFSLVRIGDGEGRILGGIEKFDQGVLYNEVLTYQFGPKIKEVLAEDNPSLWPVRVGINDLRGLLRGALSSADVVGFPSARHFQNGTWERASDRARLESLLTALQLLLARPDVSFVDHYLMVDAHRAGRLVEMLDGVSYLGVIANTDISEAISRHFHIEQVDFWKIPAHATHGVAGDHEAHFPHAFRRVVTELGDNLAGKVFLVAAGYLGKAYCQEIKDRGGIALDIGAVFDGWVGAGRPDEASDPSLRLETKP